MRNVQVKVSSSATFELYSDVGVPQGGTFALYTPHKGLIESGNFTSGSLSASFTNLSRREDSITVSDASDAVVGERALLSNSVSGRETEVTISDKTATIIYFDQDARFAIPDGSIQSHKLSYTIAANKLGTKYRNCRAVWTITGSAGKVVERTQTVDIVSDPFHLLINEEDIETIDPTFGDITGGNDSWKKLREGAIDAIWDDLWAEDIKPDLARNRGLLKTAAIYKLLELFYIRQTSEEFAVTTTLSERYREKYKLTMSKFIASPNNWVDFNDNLSTGGTRDADGDWVDDNDYYEQDELEGLPPIRIKYMG